jgi:hypothetical protein
MDAPLRGHDNALQLTAGMIYSCFTPKYTAEPMLDFLGMRWIGSSIMTEPKEALCSDIVLGSPFSQENLPGRKRRGDPDRFSG